MTSPVCLAIAFYFSSKRSGEVLAKNKIDHLTRFINVTAIDESTVTKALKDKQVHDLEDGMEYYSAAEAGCHVIVTENKDDFYYSKIAVRSCEELLTELGLQR